MTQAEQELRAALAALPDSRFEACRGAEGTGCTCGQVWASENDRIIFIAPKEHVDDLSPGYTPEQARAHAEALETILNALPHFLTDLDAARAAQAVAEAERDEARETNRSLNRRCQLAEMAANEKVRTHPTPATLGRGLANYAAATYRRERDEALEALAAAQRAEGADGQGEK